MAHYIHSRSGQERVEVREVGGSWGWWSPSRLAWIEAGADGGTERTYAGGDYAEGGFATEQEAEEALRVFAEESWA